ncbi:MULTISPECIES: hypothetical protein [unclassified Leucobacter]|uniref:hypothetical protein n=1 Tax=unclassified Leucobacter TaxID=2621730 RepID=UPI0006213B31|nr:hypothetical protein [Leucobacter sp. Ag1]KKI22665.1 hypothetical protein XM48_00655 [Leucobacter sp. Ag1]
MNPHEMMLARRRRTMLAAGILSSLLTVGLLLLVLLPGIGTAGAAEAADGKRTVAIGDPKTATIVPGAGWEVTGADSDELLLVSPDRGLTVRISPAPSGKPAEVLAAELGEGSGSGKIRTETLASKLVVAHVDSAKNVSAAVGDDRHAVLLGVELSEPDAKQAKRDLASYRPALVALVESIRLG